MHSECKQMHPERKHPECIPSQRVRSVGARCTFVFYFNFLRPSPDSDTHGWRHELSPVVLQTQPPVSNFFHKNFCPKNVFAS